eukprot:6757680-Lingulodinium_polyedra.AAC.1
MPLPASPNGTLVGPAPGVGPANDNPREIPGGSNGGGGGAKTGLHNGNEAGAGLRGELPLAGRN